MPNPQAALQQHQTQCPVPPPAGATIDMYPWIALLCDAPLLAMIPIVDSIGGITYLCVVWGCCARGSGGGVAGTALAAAAAASTATTVKQYVYSPLRP